MNTEIKKIDTIAEVTEAGEFVNKKHKVSSKVKVVDSKSKNVTQQVKIKAYNAQATGKRKTSVASFRESTKVNGLIINGKPLEGYFSQVSHRTKILAPLSENGIQLQGVVKVTGGGLTGQAEAIRHAISRFLRKSPLYGVNEELLKKLKKNGYLTRDSRKKERKKPGQEGARRNFQSQKR